jgi:transcriptional regulator with XRE-family HTH domain
MTLGDRVRELRAGAGLSQGGLAAAAGLSRNTIYRIEADRAPADFQTVVKVAAALGVDAAALMDMKLPLSAKRGKAKQATLEDVLDRLDMIERGVSRIQDDMHQLRVDTIAAAATNAEDMRGVEPAAQHLVDLVTRLEERMSRMERDKK